MVDNSTLRYKRIRIFSKITQGTSPTGSNAVYFYGLRGDKNGTPYRTDNSGASDAALTVLNAPILEVGANLASPATGDVIWKEFVFEDPGPEWGIAVVHTTVAALNSTSGNHYIRYIGEDLEVQ